MRQAANSTRWGLVALVGLPEENKGSEPASGSYLSREVPQLVIKCQRGKRVSTHCAETPVLHENEGFFRE